MQGFAIRASLPTSLLQHARAPTPVEKEVRLAFCLHIAANGHLTVAALTFFFVPPV